MLKPHAVSIRTDLIFQSFHEMFDNHLVIDAALRCGHCGSAILHHGCVAATSGSFRLQDRQTLRLGKMIRQYFDKSEKETEGIKR